MSYRNENKPLNRAATLESAPRHCLQCRVPFAAAKWPRSKWTLSGWAPWCPDCFLKYAPHKPQRSMSGPKPKGGGWTNMPIN